MKTGWPIGLLLVAALAIAGAGSTVGTGDLLALGIDAWESSLAGAGLALGNPGAFNNPAALAWSQGLKVSSTLGTAFGQVPITAASLEASHLALGGVRLASSENGADYLEEGGAAVLGLPLGGSLGLGLRLDVLHRSLPREGLGWAVDAAVLYRGPFAAAGAVNAILARSPVPGEDWSSSFSLGLGFPLELGEGIRAWVAAAAWGIGTPAAAGAIGAELRAGNLGARLGLSQDSLSLGILVAWGGFQLSLAAQLNPALSACYRATLAIEFGRTSP